MDEINARVSRSPHRPLHLYADGGCYWLTAATLGHQPLLRSDERKRMWVEEWYAAADAWEVEIVAWTLMEHHYHAVLRLSRSEVLPRFAGRVHGRVAISLNREDGCSGRRVWRQYWDTLLRTEGDFWSRINYLWSNPVRHGFCARPEDWRWTNLGPLLAEAGTDCLARFPAPRRLPGDD